MPPRFHAKNKLPPILFSIEKWKSPSSLRLLSISLFFSIFLIITCQFLIRELWGIEEEESFYVKLLLCHLILQRINSLHEDKESQELAPLGGSSRLFLTFLYGASHMGWVLNFGWKLELFGVWYERKNLKKVWKKDKEKFERKIVRRVVRKIVSVAS